MSRFVYSTVHVSMVKSAIDSLLESMASEGWRLASSLTLSTRALLIFEKETPSADLTPAQADAQASVSPKRSKKTTDVQ